VCWCRQCRYQLEYITYCCFWSSLLNWRIKVSVRTGSSLRSLVGCVLWKWLIFACFVYSARNWFLHLHEETWKGKAEAGWKRLLLRFEKIYNFTHSVKAGSLGVCFFLLLLFVFLVTRLAKVMAVVAQRTWVLTEFVRLCYSIVFCFVAVQGGRSTFGEKQRLIDACIFQNVIGLLLRFAWWHDL